MPVLGWFFLIFGAGALANAGWMLIAPQSWYQYLPAAVPDTGLFNAHFIRDIGLAFLISGAGFIWSAFNLHRCWPIFVGQAMFTCGHALLHLLDILTARLPASHWLVDFPLVFFPAIVFAILALPPVWRIANPHSQNPSPGTHP